MEGDIKVRKVTQDVLLFVWNKKKLYTAKPSLNLFLIPEISAELINNLCISVWIKSCSIGAEWEGFVNKHFKRMTTSPYLFANYVAYAFYIIGETSEAYEYFFNTLSFMTFLGVYCWQEEQEQFLNACADLFCDFFEKEIRTKFENRGGWKHLNEYLQKIYDLRKWKSLISENKSPSECFATSQDVPRSDRLQTKINGVLIGRVTWEEVETHEKAIIFANSVAGKISKLCEKSFIEIIGYFTQTYIKVSEFYKQTTIEASDRKAENEKFLLPQEKLKEASENNPSTFKSEDKTQQMQTVAASNSLKVQNLANIESQDANTSDKVLLDGQTVERAKKLMSDISMDITKLSDIIQSLFQENVVQIGV